MDHDASLRDLAGDPEALERAYGAARAAGEAEAFAAAVDAAHAAAPEDLLWAAWHHRLRAEAAAPARGHATAVGAAAWSRALPLAAACGALLWLVSDDARFALKIVSPLTGAVATAGMPFFLVVAPSIVAALVVAYLAAAAPPRARRARDAAAVALALGGLAAWVLAAYPSAGTRTYQDQYLAQMPLNLGLLAWAGVGAYVLAGRWNPADRFAFLQKSLEYAVSLGLFGALLGIFTGVTFGLFATLGIEPPQAVVRLFVVGGAGAAAVLVAALVVVPGAAPRRQVPGEGVGRLVPLLLRILLPPALAVLAVFLGFLPVNGRQLLENREVLVAFNAMLFAVVGLLVGALAAGAEDLGPRARRWLRGGVVGLAALAALIGLAALAALVGRALDDRLTPNRLAFIGWSVLNIGLLARLLVGQARVGRGDWLSAARGALVAGMAPYVAWAALILVVVPLRYGFDAAALAGLPRRIQEIAFDAPPPILLKCPGRPHIYLLEDGRKRWIRDIPTFEAQGFAWRDVHQLSCATVDAVPLGPPIPPDAGTPPD